MTGTSAVGTRYSSSRVTTYIWSSLSGIWPVPRADVGVDDDRRPDLGHAVLAGVDVEEPVDQRPLERATRRPCRPGSRSRRSWRRAARSMMSSASASSQCGFRRHVAPPAGASAPTSPSSGCSTGSCSPHVRTVTFASSPPIGTSGSAGFGMRRRRSSSCGLDVSASCASIAVIRSPASVERGLELGDLGAVGLRAALDRLADLLRRGVALGLERRRLSPRSRAPLGVEPRAPDRRARGPRPCRSRPCGSRPAPRGAAAARRSCRSDR